MPIGTRNDIHVNAKGKSFYTSERKNYDYWTSRLAQATSKKQEQIASVMRMRALMEFKTKEVYATMLLDEMEDKCLVFCNTQEQADRICTYSYHSNNPESEDNLQQFKDGNISELSCVMQLNEGVNIPDLRAGIIMHAYGNERKSSQRIGRLLRLNPNDTAYVHILCYTGTVDERWVAEALRDLDPRKIKYFDVNQESYESF
jgi:superfamily II DNA or RNA helicase